MRIRTIQRIVAFTFYWIFGRSSTGMLSIRTGRSPWIRIFLASHRTSISAFLPRRNHLSSASKMATSVFSSQSEVNSRRITFITDIEGDRDYLTRYVKQSKVLCFRPCTPRLETNFFPYQHCIDFQRPFRDYLVFGGDIWDQGGSDLYVIRQLLDLKERYPEHVYIVVGNRDINKMRLLQEMHQDEQGLLPESYGVYWLKGRKITGDPDERQLLTQSPSERLKWILRNTMGSPRAFDYRKWELEQEELLLKELKGQSTDNFTSTVTDEDVVISYQRSTHPEGEMGRYLSNGNLAIQLGEILFVHGALPFTSDTLQDVTRRKASTDEFWDDLTFAMPWLPNNTKASDMGVSSIKGWIACLNNFAKERVASWKEEALNDVPRKPFWSEGAWGYYLIDEQSSFSQLMQYGMGSIPPEGRRNPTIVYNRWCTNGMPRSFFPNSDDPTDAVFVKLVRDFFRRSGLAIICTGHQPQGDMPNPIAVPLHGCNRTAWILSCDTSYSGDVNFVNQDSDSIKRKGLGRQGSKSGRGLVAVSEVLITQCTTSGKVLDVHWHGTLSDGSCYKSSSLDFALPKQDKTQSGLQVGFLAPFSLGSPLENTAFDGPWWTRATLVDDDESQPQKYVFVHGEGFHSYNCVVESKIIQSRL